MAPRHVRGLQNLRGQLVTVLDLGERLKLGLREMGSTSCAIILKTGETMRKMTHCEEMDEGGCKDIVGLLVDKVGDVIEVEREKIEKAQSHGSRISSHFLEGVVKLNEKLLVTLNVGNILETDEEKRVGEVVALER